LPPLPSIIELLQP